MNRTFVLLLFSIASLGLLLPSPTPAQLLPGDLNLDGRVDYTDVFLSLELWGTFEHAERLFDIHEGWGDEENYPETVSALMTTLDDRGDEPLIHTGIRGVAHLYWLGRDGSNVIQLWTSTVFPWGQRPFPDQPLTHREPVQVIPGLPPGSPAFDGIRLALPEDPEDDYFIVYPGFQRRIRFIRFHPAGFRLSEEILAGDPIDNLDAVDAIPDEEGNLHVAAMARIEFGSTTRNVYHRKFDPDGNPLTGLTFLGTAVDTAGGSSELPHPEICNFKDGDVLVLWDQGEGSALNPGDPETFPAMGVRVDGQTGVAEGNIPFEEAWVEPECYWKPGVGIVIAYMQFVLGDGREIYYTVLDDTTFAPKFNPIRLSPPASTQFDGAQIFPVGDEFYIAFNREGSDPLGKPQIARVTAQGQVTGPFAVDGPRGGGLFEGPVRIGVDGEENAHLVYGTENFVDPNKNAVNYVRTRIE